MGGGGIDITSPVRQRNLSCGNTAAARQVSSAPQVTAAIQGSYSKGWGGGRRPKILLASNRNWWDASSSVGGSVSEIGQCLDLLVFVRMDQRS